MRLKNTSVFICALALAPLCVARTREDEVAAQVTGPHFSSLPDGILVPEAPLPKPEKPFSAWDREFAILNGGRHRDNFVDSKVYIKKDTRYDPWWPNPNSQRPPKRISPKGHHKLRSPVHHRR